jgi:hypothetical protein
LGSLQRWRILIRAGIDVVTVAELLGLASLDPNRIYVPPTDGDLDAAINGSPLTGEHR